MKVKEIFKRDQSGKFSTKTAKIVKYVIAYLIIGSVLFGLMKLTEWMVEYKRHYYFEFKSPVVFQKPIERHEKRNELMVGTREIVTVIEEDKYPEWANSDIKKKVCDKWGIEECKVAIAVCMAESGCRQNAINVNGNGTVDWGIYQINSIHWDRFGGLENLVSIDQQLEVAYTLWVEQGWTPWVVFQTNAFKQGL